MPCMRFRISATQYAILLVLPLAMWQMAPSLAAQPARIDTNGNTAVPMGQPAIPIPLVSALFLQPAAVPVLSHVTTPGECQARVQRVLDSLSFLQRDTLFRDSTTSDPWSPFPAGVVEQARRCVDHWSVAALPIFALNRAIAVARAANADSLVQALVARKLAAIAQASAETHIAVLDSVIDMLMAEAGRNPWEYGLEPKTWWTPAHIQLAEGYEAQQRQWWPKLGSWRPPPHRVEYAVGVANHDVDTLLALEQHAIQYIQDELHTGLPVAARPAAEAWLADRQGALDELTYLKTTSAADLATLLAHVRARSKFGRLITYDTLTGKHAPPLAVDYWFNTPTPNSAPPLAVPGTLSLLVLLSVNCQNDVRQCLLGNAGQRLRQLQQTFPALRIIVVTQTHGWFRQQDWANRPGEEAARLHQYFTDSLGFPGIFGVVRTTFQRQTGPDAHVVPVEAPLMNAYEVGRLVQAYIEPDGTVVELDALRSSIPGGGDWEDTFLHNWFSHHPAR